MSIALCLTLLLCAGSSQQLFAQSSGNAAILFLQIEPDSRSAAMGNANVAVADNAYALFWNPAGLGFQEGSEASITHSQWLPGLSTDLFYDYLVGKYHMPGWGTFGAHVTFLNLGEHEARDAAGNYIDTFRSYDIAVGASYGVKLTERFSVGTGLRFIYSNLAPGQSVGLQETRAGVSAGFDLAGLYRTAPFDLGGISTTASAGFNLANMGPHITYSDRPQEDPIPTNLRAGWSMRFDFDEYNSLTISNDFNKLLVDRDTLGSAAPFYQAMFTSWRPVRVSAGPNNGTTTVSPFEQITVGAGLEYWYNNLFAIRSGYFYENPNYGNRQFLTLGAGIRYHILGVDFSYVYALEENHPLSNTMRFSLLLNFGRL